MNDTVFITFSVHHPGDMWVVFF